MLLKFFCKPPHAARKEDHQGHGTNSSRRRMAAKDARDRGLLNHFGILRSPPKAAPSFRAPAPIHVFKGASSGWERPYVFGAQPDHRSVVVNCKPPHAAEDIAGRVSVNANCKPPHAGQELPGRVSVNANCKPPHAADVVAGRMSGNVNCKPPHAADVVAGRRFVNGNSIFEDGTKGEWFFDESCPSTPTVSRLMLLT